MLEEMGEDIVIQKKRQKLFFFVYIVDLGTIMGFFK